MAGSIDSRTETERNNAFTDGCPRRLLRSLAPDVATTLQKGIDVDRAAVVSRQAGCRPHTVT